MTTVEGTDTETSARMALAAIEQMFDDAMAWIEARHRSMSECPDEPNADHCEEPHVHRVEEEHDPTEEINCQAA